MDDENILKKEADRIFDGAYEEWANELDWLDDINDDDEDDSELVS